MRPDRKTIVRSVALGLGLVVLGMIPWPRLPLGFSAIYCAIANAVVFDHTTFGQGGHAHLTALDALTSSPGDSVTADTVLALTVDRYQGAFTLGLSLKRDAYLPLLLVVALLVAAPGFTRRRWRALLTGLTVIFGCTIAVIDLLVRWTFVFQLKAVYDASPFWRGLLDVLYSALLVPPANRFIVPSLVAVFLIWRSRTAAPAPAGPQELADV